MAFISILDKNGVPEQAKTIPVFIEDLNLDQIIKKLVGLQDKDWRYNYFRFPENEECELYRRAVLQDVKREEVRAVLLKLRKDMEGYYEIRGKEYKVSNPVQKTGWHVERARVYKKIFNDLQKELSALTFASEGFRELTDYVTAYIESDAMKRFEERIVEIKEHLSGISFLVTVENDKILLQPNLDSYREGDYEAFLDEALPGDAGKVKNLFGVGEDWNTTEKKIMTLYQERNKPFFDKAERFYNEFKEFEDSTLMKFTREMEFYLSFYDFMKEREAAGYVFSVPKRNGGEFFAKGVYDLALSLVKEDGRVVANDFSYADRESFFVVSGPNQGGKTTFARSLGQLVYFAKMGLDVPAEEAVVPYVTNVLSHFSVEESSETGRGKLKEELIRLRPMMKEDPKDAFVIINELFTTAANFDAIEMGTRVLRFFIENGARGIYVTHLSELAKVHEQIVSMQAKLNEEGKQCFLVKRGPVEDVSCAINQVMKHNLTYEGLKERLQ